MSSVNKSIIVGRMGKDPEVFEFRNGDKVVNLSVATSERWIDRNTGEKKERTEWHRVSIYGALGDIAIKYLTKGSLVYVEGSMQTREYQDKQGNQRFTTSIRASEIRMLGGSKKDTTPFKEHSPAEEEPKFEKPIIDADDMPF